jgi:hypothetical protein
MGEEAFYLLPFLSCSAEFVGTSFLLFFAQPENNLFGLTSEKYSRRKLVAWGRFLLL